MSLVHNPRREQPRLSARELKQFVRAVQPLQPQQHHQPEKEITNDALWNNACLWVFIIVFVALVVMLIVSVYVWPPPLVGYGTGESPWVFKRHSVRQECHAVHGEALDPEVGICGPIFRAPLAFEPHIMDPTYSACDASFYHMMCGTWIAEHQNEHRTFSYVYNKNQARVRQIIQEGDVGSPLRRFYQSCVHARAETGKQEAVVEYRHLMENIANTLNSHADLPDVFGKLAALGYTTPFVLSIERHPTQRQWLPLIMPDNFPGTLNEQQVIQAMIAGRVITHYNVAIEQERIQGVLRVIHALRTHVNTSAALTNVTDYRSYVRSVFPLQVMRFDALPQQWQARGHEGAPIPGWQLFFQSLGLLHLQAEHQVWVVQRAYFQWFCTTGMAQIELNDWRAFVEFSILYNGHKFDPELPNDVYWKQHDAQGPVGPDARIYHRPPRSTPGAPTEATNVEHQCVLATQHLLPGLVARAYMDRHMPEALLANVRKDVLDIMSGLNNTMRAMIVETRWLSAQSKVLLLQKLQQTQTRIAAPDVWEPEPFAQSLLPDAYDHNVNMIRRYRVQRNLALWNTPFTHMALAFFAMPLTEVNAYYSGSSNSITILAGILQAPFYDYTYSVVSKYAVLGSIVAHEMSHMLDVSGMFWDAYGSMQVDGVISAADMEAFFRATDCVIEQYGPAPGGCDDLQVPYGNQTVAEDMADLMGIQMAYRALFDVQTERPLGDKQHFFMVLAQAFCESYDQTHLCQVVQSDVHAVAEFRIDRTLRNIPAFRTAFACRQGQGMWRDAKDVCKTYGT